MTRAAALRSVPWLSSLGDAELERVASACERVTFRDGKPLLGELEVGDELFILLEGSAVVSVAAGGGRRQEVGVLRAGDACGEISLLTRQLRSATVVADGDVVALRLDRATFDRLVTRHPSIAVHFARLIAARLSDTRAELDALLANPSRESMLPPMLAGRSAAVVPERGSIRLAWRELVVGQRRELPFFALAAFVVTLPLVRLAAWAVEGNDAALFEVLRAAYTTGIALVFASTAISLARFRVPLQRALAIVYGVGFALILNELSVFLAFDTFYLNMTTRDPELLFSVTALYRRSESEWAVALMLVLLVQLAFMRRFYKRALYVLETRVRALF